MQLQVPANQPPLDQADQSKIAQINAWRTRLGKMEGANQLRIRQASMGEITGRIFYRLVKSLAPLAMLEVGTCVGISAAYTLCGADAGRALQHPEGELPVMQFTGTEGVEEKRLLAIQSVTEFWPEKCDWDIRPGNFDETLQTTIEQCGPFDFAYLDGQHLGDKTIRNFDWIVAAMPAGGVIVVDDLDWSGGMREAGRYMLRHKRVRKNIDLRRLAAFEIKAW